MTTAADAPGQDRAGTGLLAALSAVPLLVLLATAFTPGYGYFIDEFYYLSCARRLAFGYVDHPPLAPAILAAVNALAGHSVLAIRLLPFLAASATVWLTGLLVRRLGGGRFAVVAACLGVGLMPVQLALSSFYSMNAFEPLLWTLALLVLARLVQAGESRWWLVVGLLLGLAFENKHTLVAYAIPLAVGIVATRPRALRDPWLWAGAGLAILVALPNVLWQAANGWPSLEFYRNAQLLKNVQSSPVRSLLALVVVANPLLFPVWLAGLAWLLAAREARGCRFLGVAGLLVLAGYLFSGTSRPDRPAAMLPLLVAAGSVAAERWLRGRVSRAALVALPAVLAVALAPVAIPLLPPAATARYASALGLTFQLERGKTAPLPQPLADRTGWESFVDDVAAAAGGLAPAERRRAVVYAPSYGHAGALELWGPARGLPPVISGQNTWWHWSVGRAGASVLIAVSPDVELLRAFYRDVRQVGLVECDYCMSWRSRMPIYVARDPIASFERAWPLVRHYE